MKQRISITGINSQTGLYSFPDSELFARRKVVNIVPIMSASENRPASSDNNIFLISSGGFPEYKNLSMYLNVIAKNGVRIMQNVPLASLVFGMPFRHYKLYPFYFNASASTLQIVSTNFNGVLPGSVEFQFTFE